MNEGVAEVPQKRRPLIGLLFILVGAGVLTAFASVTPAGLRKLLLFAVGFGLVTGWLVAWAARENGVPRLVALVVSTILTLGGLTFTAMQSYAQLVAAQQAANREKPDNLLGLNMLEGAAEDDPEVAELLARRRRELQPEFVDYLATRVSALGDWPRPWPTAFWAGELLLAVVAGGIVVIRKTAEPSAVPGDSDGAHCSIV